MDVIYACRTSAISVVFVAILGACANQGYSVVAVTATTIGVGVSQQPAAGGLEATLGYKRSELAFVPTNRRAPGDSTDAPGGAQDCADVIMELGYETPFSFSNGGIYQRLAVGKNAVLANGSTMLFAKKSDGTYDQAVLDRLLEIPPVAPAIESIKAEVREKFNACSDDKACKEKVIQTVKREGFKDLADFMISQEVSQQQAERILSAIKQ